MAMNQTFLRASPDAAAAALLAASSPIDAPMGIAYVLVAAGFAAGAGFCCAPAAVAIANANGSRTFPDGLKNMVRSSSMGHRSSRCPGSSALAGEEPGAGRTGVDAELLQPGKHHLFEGADEDRPLPRVREHPVLQQSGALQLRIRLGEEPVVDGPREHGRNE